MSKKQPPESPSLRVNVEVPSELEAVYSNLVVIRHSSSEIVIDFIRRMPDVVRARVYSRVVMTPMNAKLFLQALEKNLDAYEEKFGEIRTAEHGFEEDRPIGFAP
jgi:hypothetical protein